MDTTSSSFGAKIFPGGYMPQASILSQHSQESSLFGQHSSVPSRGKDGKDQPAGSENVPKDGPASDTLQEDMAKCNFSVTPLKLMRILAESLSSPCMDNICWQLDPAGSGSTCTSFLDYAETEVIYA